jgi:hypothetical protein
VRGDLLVQCRHTATKIIRYLLACKPTGQCDPQRILAEFVRPF